MVRRFTSEPVPQPSMDRTNPPWRSQRQASGPDAASASFAALFVQEQTTVPRTFTATGPVANLDIDAAVLSAMEAYPMVRHAALAIVHGTELVYARGYTLAEPDWPMVQPTTYFRLASGSKVVTALAIYQLLESGALDAATSVQDILQLSTPGPLRAWLTEPGDEETDHAARVVARVAVDAGA